MENKDCSIICEGKEVAKINFGKDGFNIVCTEAGRKMCKGAKCC